MFGCELDRLFLCIIENDVSEHGACGIVHVDDDLLSALDRLESSADEILASGSQDLSLRLIKMK